VKRSLKRFRQRISSGEFTTKRSFSSSKNGDYDESKNGDDENDQYQRTSSKDEAEDVVQEVSQFDLSTPDGRFKKELHDLKIKFVVSIVEILVCVGVGTIFMRLYHDHELPEAFYFSCVTVFHSNFV